MSAPSFAIKPKRTSKPARRTPGLSLAPKHLAKPVIMPTKKLTIQAKLTIGQPNDKYEQEADRVADQVMRMSDADVAQRVETGTVQPMRVQRLCPECKQETAQRQPASDEDEALQAKEMLGQIPILAPNLESRINSLKGGGQPLDSATRSFFEPRFGHEFSKVRVHSDSSSADTARSINARAFTLGNHLVMGAGEYQPRTQTGQRLLGHELTHVIQQREGGLSGKGKAPLRKSIDTHPIDNPVVQRLQNEKHFGGGDEYLSLSIPDGSYVLEAANIPATVTLTVNPVRHRIYATASQFTPRQLYGLDAHPHELTSGITYFRIQPGRSLESVAGQGSAKIQVLERGLFGDTLVAEAYLRFDTVPFVANLGSAIFIGGSIYDLNEEHHQYFNLTDSSSAGQGSSYSKSITNGSTLKRGRSISNTLSSTISSEIGTEIPGLSAKIGSEISTSETVTNSVERSISNTFSTTTSVNVNASANGPGRFVIIPTAKVWITPVEVNQPSDTTGNKIGTRVYDVYTIIFNDTPSVLRVNNGRILDVDGTPL